ncbi:23S rRNA (guanosine-2'-O-)-methyltransferase RlmB [Pragia fontium]|uniref:RNA methyltransferase, TrmH family n=2 Tax=Pragia fontium TaxID=82985 RepID=A0AAJ5BHU0_9GAMM|nr:tRNA/rRNA methyltransferase [Pragia fontium]AKJ43004.1 methyltransferase [Pragia fontium]GKX64011.1 tRNA/rRNA methyltransferase [Pragia fontium]SFD08309.1 RNA methyltransferase, TrmH family [Pragia fontium DSM 5563 = ATCC 49100]SUB83433.1 23S rRNA (guanosine-2'-O-)-methyltransferase RlmB [Pragia fontium]
MSDSFSGKNGKVKVMYVRSDDNKDEKSNKRSDKNRAGNKGDSRGDKNARWGDNDRPRRPVRSANEKPPRSPWQARLQDASEPEPFDHGGISGKSQIDPAQLRRQREQETKVYGENACQALFQSRPEAIVRAYFIQSVTPRFKEALRWMAANRKAYHVVEEEELIKVSGTEHHGGVCFLIKKRTGLTVADYLAKASKTDCVLALENVGNPHNLGGMMRSCAHFGVKGVLLRDPGMLESGAAIRTAEGGAEHLTAIGIDDFPEALDAFRRAGYTIITTSSHKGTSLSQAVLPAKTVLVLGEERDGLSDVAMKQSDMSISIDGTGNVESLNVSVATGILLAEWWRQNSAK